MTLAPATFPKRWTRTVRPSLTPVLRTRPGRRRARHSLPARRWLALVAAAGFLLAAVPVRAGDGAAAGADPAAAQRRIATMVGALDALSARTGLSDAALAEGCGAILREHVNLAGMGRKALGEAAWRLSDADWAAFRAAYARHLALGFVRGVREIGPSVTRILGSRVTGAGAVAVFTRVRAGGRERDVTWILCRDDPARVCDVETDGVLASSHQRSAFADRLRTGGARDLIRALEAGWLVELP